MMEDNAKDDEDEDVLVEPEHDHDDKEEADDSKIEDAEPKQPEDEKMSEPEPEPAEEQTPEDDVSPAKYTMTDLEGVGYKELQSMCKDNGMMTISEEKHYYMNLQKQKKTNQVSPPRAKLPF